MSFFVAAILIVLLYVAQKQLTILHWERKMALDLSGLNAAVAAIAEDVTAVATVVADLKALIAELQGQLAQGVLDQAAVDSAAAALAQADVALDAVTAPAV
jgi:hypothetical protein